MQINRMKILSISEVEEIESIIEKNYGAKVDLGNYLVLETEIERKIWITSKNFLNFDLSKLNVNSIGMNFGKLKRNNKINLTIEGSQIVGKTATKNIVLLNKENSEKFMKGTDVNPDKEINCEQHNFVIVKSVDNILGSSLLREDKIENLIPKSRRVFK